MPPVKEIWADGPALVTSILRHLTTVLAAGAVGGVALFALLSAQQPVYEAGAELVFSEARVRALDPDEGAERLEGERQLRNRMNRIRSRPVLERASELLGGEIGASTLRDMTDVVAEPERLDSAVIVAWADTPGAAASYANAVGEAYEQVVAEQERTRVTAAIVELDAVIERLERRRTELDGAAGDPTAATAAATQRGLALAQIVELAERRERLQVAAEMPESGIAAFEPAVAPSDPIAPRPRLGAALGAFLGLALGSAYAYWREGRPRIGSAGELRLRPHGPVLGSVPRPPGRRWLAPSAPAALIDRSPQPYEFLALALERVLDERPSAAVLFTAVTANRGDTGVALNAAVALCEDRRRVVLVDADLRRRTLTRLWRVEERSGLAELRDPQVPVDEHTNLVGVAFGRGTLHFLPAGTREADPLRCLRGPVVTHLLTGLEERRPADTTQRVVLHAPPVLDAADASAIARLVDGVVLIVRAGTSVADLEEAEARLALAGGRFLGYAFVGRGRRSVRPAPAPPPAREATTRSGALR